MQDRPNEQMDRNGAEEHADEASGVRTDAARAGDQTGPERQSSRWIQLAYDLEQYGDGEAENRGEVF